MTIFRFQRLAFCNGAKEAEPGANIVGLDADEKILEIARNKAAKAGVELLFDRCMSYQLPFSDESFDRVLSSLVLHHLSTADKNRTFLEVFRGLASLR